MEKNKEDDSAPQDDFKWFGEGFDGFPKRLPDDTVEYVIHIIDSKLATDSQVRESLRGVEAAASLLSKKLLKDYIWQREPFKLDLKREDGTWMLRGTTNYGDSVADEWVVVYMLRELSKQFPEAWVRVYDTDGEFLLIEAANALPKWLNPEVAENRVWMNGGLLKVIPLEGVPGPESKRPLTVQEAKDFIKSQPSKIIHSPMVEEEAFYRLRNYPAEISENLHHALVTIPRKLAFILHRKPSYISPAVEAFYLRDPISLKALRKDGPGALSFPPDDLVTVRVRFTKVGYAQLKSQEFTGPKAWEDVLAKVKPLQEKDRLQMGLKLACGFDMLIADPQNQDKPAVREMQMLLEDLESGDEELPSVEEIKTWETSEDDDSWMNINYEDFERELAGKKAGGAQPGAPTMEGFGDKAAQENLRKMVERFESFLNDDTAGPEGAEPDDMDFDDDEDEDDDDDDDDSEVSSEGEDKAASFDEEEFSKMMREMMGMPEDVYKEIMEMPIDDLKKFKEKEVDARLKEKEAEAKMYGPPRPPPPGSARVEELSSDDDDEEYDPKEAEEFRKMMADMEAELKEAGALNLDPKPREDEQKTIKGKGKGKGKAKADDDVEEVGGEEEDEVVEVDYNLVKNLLEAFKGQGGMAGPAGNMMGMMGVNMPRDEPDKK